MRLEEHLRTLLDAAAADGLLRSPTIYDGAPTHPVVGGRHLISFASNDYLGLAAHPALRERLAEASASLPGPGSSRVVAGTSTVHAHAEEALADHVAQPDARLFSSAYAANLAALGLFGAPDVILSDALNHASLIDGARLSRARVVVYRHGDLEHVDQLLRQHVPAARVCAVVTETVFSMDADVADLVALRRLTDEHGAALFVDEAHALGVVGDVGGGVCASRGVTPDVLVGGLGKAFGLAGGFVAGSRSVTRALDNVGRTMLFSTAILPALAAAVPLATQLLRGASTERARLHDHVHLIRAAAKRVGWSAPGEPPAPIVPMLVGPPQPAVALSRDMREQGFVVPVMRPPTVPAGTSRMRWSPSARHSTEDVRRACDAFAALASGSPAERQSDRQAGAT